MTNAEEHTYRTHSSIKLPASYEITLIIDLIIISQNQRHWYPLEFHSAEQRTQRPHPIILIVIVRVTSAYYLACNFWQKIANTSWQFHGWRTQELKRVTNIKFLLLLFVKEMRATRMKLKKLWKMNTQIAFPLNEMTGDFCPGAGQEQNSVSMGLAIYSRQDSSVMMMVRMQIIGNYNHIH